MAAPGATAPDGSGDSRSTGTGRAVCQHCRMPRYLMECQSPLTTDDELVRLATHFQKVRDEQFPELTWERTHVVRTPEGMRLYCVYAGPDANRLRQHAAAAGIPAETVQELHTELIP